MHILGVESRPRSKYESVGSVLGKEIHVLNSRTMAEGANGPGVSHHVTIYFVNPAILDNY